MIMDAASPKKAGIDEADFIVDLLEPEMIRRKPVHTSRTYLMPGTSLTSLLVELDTTYSIHPIIISS